ncbi:MAG TPA: hypothetical protein VN715_09730 [Roseiarcus sp.]|nr:hypothetical protein [Roseiarcus sp.]
MGSVMHVSFSALLDTTREQHTIGRITAYSPWRAADRELGDLDREIATRALVRAAEDYEADGVVEIAYAVEECRSDGHAALTLRRIVASGRAVRLALAA